MIYRRKDISPMCSLCFIDDRLVTLEVHSLLKVSQPFHTYTTAEKARVCWALLVQTLAETKYPDYSIRLGNFKRPLQDSQHGKHGPLNNYLVSQICSTQCYPERRSPFCNHQVKQSLRIRFISKVDSSALPTLLTSLFAQVFHSLTDGPANALCDALLYFSFFPIVFPLQFLYFDFPFKNIFEIII